MPLHSVAPQVHLKVLGKSNVYITAPETANIPKLIKIRQNYGCYLEEDFKNIFFFLKTFLLHSLLLKM